MITFLIALLAAASGLAVLGGASYVAPLLALLVVLAGYGVRSLVNRKAPRSEGLVFR